MPLSAGENKAGEGCGIEYAGTPRAETEGDAEKAQLWLDVDRSLNHFELSIYGVCVPNSQTNLLQIRVVSHYQ